MDFILGDHTAIEVKAKENVSPQDLRSLKALQEEGELRRYLCECLEPTPRKLEGITMLPNRKFLEDLWSGEYRA